MIRNTSKDNNYASDYSDLTILKKIVDKYGIAKEFKSSVLVQNKSLVKNGIFDFERLGKKGIGFDKGNYILNISLAIPSVQNKEFVLRAGIEY